MRGWLAVLRAAFRRWRQANRAAHRQATTGACCASPDAVYAGRKAGKDRRG